MNKLTIIIRLVVTAVLIYFVYQETGLATATAITFIMVYCEMQNWVNKNLMEVTKQTLELMRKLLTK
jgi:glycerol uptake facilitator-like aquaporin